MRLCLLRTVLLAALALSAPAWSGVEVSGRLSVDAYLHDLSEAVVLERSGHAAQAALAAGRAAERLAITGQQFSRGSPPVVPMAWRAAGAARALAAAELRGAAGRQPAVKIMALRRSALLAFQQVAQALPPSDGAVGVELEPEAQAGDVRYTAVAAPRGAEHSGSVRF